MGFDLSIELHIQIDKDTGVPSVFKTGSDDFKLTPFVPANFVVPEEFRKFIRLRGHMFHAYVDVINSGDTFEANCYDLLECYPSWKDVAEDVWYQDKGYEDYWTEREHYDFKRALEWFNSKGGFFLSWSY